jgi:hypothetical protein
MAIWCDAGQRNCDALTQEVKFDLNFDPTKNRYDVIQDVISLCQNGIELGATDAELSICGLVAVAKHNDELDVLQEISEGEV